MEKKYINSELTKTQICVYSVCKYQKEESLLKSIARYPQNSDLFFLKNQKKIQENIKISKISQKITKKTNKSKIYKKK